MKANELMIGDWYLASKQYSTIDGDYTLEFYPKKLTIDDLIFAKENDWNNCDWDEFTEPIQLTKEILEKNGFKLLKCKIEMQSDNSIITFYGNHLDIIISEETEQIRFSKNIKYIHELQHALRLCGLSELVDNFKI